MRAFLVFLGLCALAQPRVSLAKELNTVRELGTVKGRVLVPAGSTSPANAVVHLFTADGQLLKAFCDSDGSFTLPKVPKGLHILQANLIGYFYPEIRVETGSRGNFIRAFFMPPNSKQVLGMQEPLMVRPLGEMQYYEKRKPLDVWSILKSPYGIMIVVSVLVIFVFPKMKVDPEEYKQFQEQIKGTPAPAGGAQPKLQNK